LRACNIGITDLRLVIVLHFAYDLAVGNLDDGPGFELENLFRAFTGFVLARDFLPEEVSGPHTF
jgi:hypothetical protein